MDHCTFEIGITKWRERRRTTSLSDQPFTWNRHETINLACISSEYLFNLISYFYWPFQLNSSSSPSPLLNQLKFRQHKLLLPRLSLLVLQRAVQHQHQHPCQALNQSRALNPEMRLLPSLRPKPQSRSQPHSSLLKW